MDPIMGGALMGGANLLGSIFGTTQNNQMAQQMQQQAENYNTQMSNTAYQRATADMKAAGLNPMMMFGSGSAASSPTIQPAQMQSPVSKVGDAVSTFVNSATGLRTANATIDNLVQENANMRTKQYLDQANIGKTYAEGQLATSRGKLSDAALSDALNDALRAQHEMEFRATPAGKLLDQAGMAGRSASDVVSPITNIISSATGASRASSYAHSVGRDF